MANIRRLYAYEFFFGFAFFAPIIILFFQDNGLDYSDILLLQAMFAMAVVALEIPSGYLADVLGRRESLMISPVFLTAGMVAYGFGEGFWDFAIGEMLYAAGISLISGCDSAIIYESLLEERRVGDYKKILGNIIAARLLATAGTAAVGGYLGGLCYSYTFHASATAYLPMVLIAYTLREPVRKRPKVQPLGDMKRVAGIIWVRRDVLYLMLFAAFLFTSMQSGFYFYQPYLVMSGLGLGAIGLVFATYNLFAAWASRGAHDLEKRFGFDGTMVLLTCFLVAGFVLMGTFTVVFSFAFVYLHQLIRGAYNVVTQDYIHGRIESDYRATIISVQGFLSRTVHAGVLLCIGSFADSAPIGGVFYALAVFGAVSCGLTFALFRFKKRMTNPL